MKPTNDPTQCHMALPSALMGTRARIGYPCYVSRLAYGQTSRIPVAWKSVPRNQENETPSKLTSEWNPKPVSW